MSSDVRRHVLPSLTINRKDGSIRIEDRSVIIASGLPRANIVNELADFYRASLAYKNGYEWLSFHKVRLGAVECGFALCIHEGVLCEVNMAALLPGLELEGGWPTRQYIDQQVSYLRKELGVQLRRSFRSGVEEFSWGTAWARFDSKVFQASAGLRYAA